MSREAQVSFSPDRRWRIGFNVVLSAVVLLAILIMANYLAARHPQRIELNSPDDRALSSLTLNVLQGLTNKVSAIMFFNRRNPLYDPVVRLLRQYEKNSPLISIERVDYESSPGRAAEILARYKRDPSEGGDRVLFESNGRVEVVHEGELSEYENATQEILEGKDIQRTGFRGEQLFTSAIFSITYGRSLKAYFLQGHGESDPQKDPSMWGYAEFVRVLRESSVELAEVELHGGSVPQDCQLLVIAGARRQIPDAELQEIDRYLKRGGRLLVLFDLRALDEKSEISRLDGLLWEWGVDVGRNKVSDQPNARVGGGEELLVRDFGSHSITKPLRRSARVALAVPRTVRPRSTTATGADAPAATGLLYTGPNAVTMRAADGKQEMTGQPLCLAVAVEKGNIQGVTADRGITRVVVVGDSLTFGNALMQVEANRDFARNVVNWLLNQEVLIEKIGPRPLNEYKLSLSQSELTTARWILLVGMPGSVLALGWFVWLRRRS